MSDDTSSHVRVSHLYDELLCYCGIFAAMPVSVLSNLGNGMFVVFKQ